MKQQVLIKVYMNKNSRSSGHSVFERILYMDNSIMFPFNKVCEVMKLFYGENSVITVEQANEL